MNQDISIQGNDSKSGHALPLNPEHELCKELIGLFGQGRPELLFQAMVASGSRRVLALEALFRWRSVQNPRLITPQPLLNKLNTEQMHKLFIWVLEESVAQLHHLQLWSGWEGQLWINIEADQFSHPDLLEIIGNILLAYRWPGKRLILEITEHRAGPNPMTSLNNLERLKRVGVQLALDDFGHGFSSTSRLAIITPSFIKTSNTLLRGMDENPKQVLLFQSIQKLAFKHQCQLVTEGVETEAQANRMEELGVEIQQGYLYGRPAPIGWWALQLTESDRMPKSLIAETSQYPGEATNSEQDWFNQD